MSDFALGVDISADASGVEEGLNKAQAAFDNFGQSAQSSGEKAGDAFKGAGDSTSQLGDKLGDLAGKIVAAFAVDKIVDFGAKCKDAFEEAQQAGALLEFAVTKIGGGSEETFKDLIDWTEQYSKSLNSLYTPKELEGAEKQLSLLGLNSSQIKQLLPLVTDYAQATGKDLSEAANVAVQAINGHSRGLKDIGGQFKDTGTMLGNYNTLLEKFKVVQGAATTEMGTAANQEKELTNQIELQEEKIGEGLTPAWLKMKAAFVDFFATAVDGLKSVNDALNEADNNINKQAQADSFKATSDEVSKYQATLKAAGQTQEQIAAATKKYLAEELEGYKKVADEAYAKGDYKGQAAASAQMGGVSDYIKQQYGGGEKDNLAGKTTQGGAATDAADKIKSLDEIIAEAHTHMTAFGDTNIDSLKKEVDDINKAMQSLLDKGLQNTKQFKDLARALPDIKSKLGNAEFMSKQAVGPAEQPGDRSSNAGLPDITALEKIKTPLQTIAEEAMSAKNAIALFGKVDNSRLIDGLQQVEQKMLDLKNLGKDSGSAWDSLIAQQKAFKVAIDGATDAMEKQSETVQEFSKMASSAFSTIASDMGKSFAGQKMDLGKDIIEMLSSFAKELGAKLIEVGTAAMLGASVMPFLGLTGGTALAAGLALEAVGSAGSAIKMASGGVVSGSAFVNVGEYPGAAHNPEVIAPLNKLQGMLGGGEGGGHLTARVSGDDLLFLLNRAQQRQGNVNGASPNYLGNY